jgi:replicative DNA helicase
METAFECGNDPHRNVFEEFDTIKSQHGADFMPVEDVEERDNDLSGLLDRLAERASWRFNIPSLSRRIAGGAGGDFMIAFARPEAGKTAFHVSLACAPGGFCHQGAHVYVLCNEEPGDRTALRAISACTGMNREALEANISAASGKWNAVRNNYHIIDTVDMTMQRLNAYAKRHKPDVLIIDQLDKVYTHGQFARVDQRLREVYRLAREIAKRHDCFVIGISQASADAEGKTILTYSMMEESKTGKAAEADLIIGIGKRGVDDAVNPSSFSDDRQRHLTVSKNKITGWHGTVNPVLEGELSWYHD